MLAFLKRRWILLSCAGGLFGCSLIDEYEFSHRDVISEIGLKRGSFVFCRYPENPNDMGPWEFFAGSYIHRPMFGGLPNFRFKSNTCDILIPLWLPLSVILGWIVVLELRWREKRAKECSTSEASR